MTAIIDNDIQRRNLLAKVLPEFAVFLITDKDFYAMALVFAAVWLDIHAIDVCFWAEIIPPHLKAAAAINTDLKDMDLLAAEALKVAIIDVEIMQPLPDTVAFGAGIKKLAQVILTRWGFKPLRRGIAVQLIIIAALDCLPLPEWSR